MPGRRDDGWSCGMCGGLFSSRWYRDRHLLQGCYRKLTADELARNVVWVEQTAAEPPPLNNHLNRG